MRKILLVLAILASALFAEAWVIPDTNLISIVPKPVRMKIGNGKFTITRQTPVLVRGKDEETMKIARIFVDRILYAGGPKLTIRSWEKSDKNTAAVVFSQQPNKSKLPPESYQLTVNEKHVILSAHTGAGLFRGVQTLFQILPSEIVRHNLPFTYKEWQIPSVEITDYPRFPYRGMHLDVSRHFFPLEFVKRYIDLIAMYKMNTFHWHLTDDNGWRIEIKKYPRLTEISAWRTDHEGLPWRERPPQQPGDKTTYGGYYTQKEIREIVQFAADRYITVIPEIEMPAHCVEVLAAYPSLSCTRGPFTVPTGSYWPNIDIFCAGNDSVFTFLEDVLTEVIDLFPSTYIHIGGDEADKTNWKTCPKCQSRIKNEGLKDEKALQSYFIQRIEKFIISKGRKMIGWDEILEGGLAPEATVMSWRGVEGAIAAARQGHDAIMTPGTHCYFDYYQADPDFEPAAIGGLITLKKVYSFEPVPEELSRQEARHILGAQGNLWTEFIPTPAQAEYMAVARMVALSEVTWTPPELKDWHDFQVRMTEQYVRLLKMKVNVSRGSFKVDVRTEADERGKGLKLILDSEQFGLSIHYTLNGDEVTAESPVYSGPITVTGNGLVRAAIFENGKMKEKETSMQLVLHKAVGKRVDYLSPYSYRYPSTGKGALTDGLRGSTNHRDGYWQGFHGSDLDIIIDLGQEQPVNSVQTNYLFSQKSWIFLPRVVEYSLSGDGKKYHSFNEVFHKVSPKEEKTIIHPFNFQFRENTKARYIRIKAKNPAKCPPWHEGAGEPCWIFTDEIVVF